MLGRKGIVLLGAPGVGKGTQAKMLAEKFALSHISTGDILRDAVRAGTELGKNVRQVMEAGELVSDELVSEVVRERVLRDDRNRGFIFDGYPRTVAQAEYLEKIMSDTPIHAINLHVDEEQLLKRLTGRRSCSGCGRIYNVYFSPPEKEGICAVCGSELVQRKDDREEVVQERLRVYRQQTEPVIAFYKARSNYSAVDGNRDVKAVFGDLCKIVSSSSAESPLR